MASDARDVSRARLLTEYVSRSLSFRAKGESLWCGCHGDVLQQMEEPSPRDSNP